MNFTVVPNLASWTVQFLLTLGITSFSVTVVAPASALQVKVAPEQPHLGDTLSVTIEQDSTNISKVVTSNPIVTFNHKSYPTFLIAPNRFRVLLPTTPLDQPGNKQIQVKEADQEQKVSVYLGDRSFPIQHIHLSPQKADLEASTDELKRIEAFKQLDTPQKFWNGLFLRPNKGPITTVYGVRRYYNGEFAKDYYHAGIDYAGAFGSPVIAPAAGRVALVGRESQGFRIHGNCIGIDHGQGVASIFMHLSKIYVKEGDFVQAGQVIGALGSTGLATGPNLHWGLYVQGKAVDPEPWRNYLH
ncbi:MAG: M23 family metallopeptidase [Chroococcidiopsidaceae cyanobacterium CP_BM_ER_R8_30]|nr:M23 family metallopeptidase [Chroococcidiopsidaceae cyanobacterium CP_BM_ER_R8_30]